MKKIFLLCAYIFGGYFAFGQEKELKTANVFLSCTENISIPYTIETENSVNATIYRLKIQLPDSVHWKEMRLEWEYPYHVKDESIPKQDLNNISDKFFVNGFQSWTESRERNAAEKIPDLSKIAKPLMGMYGDYHFAQTKHQKGEIWGWNYGYIRQETDKMLLFASLNETKGYTQITFDVINHKIILRKELEKAVWKKGDYVAMEILVANGKDKECFDAYFEKGKFPKSTLSPQTGWTSWYNYYTNISQSIIMENVAAFAKEKTPIQYVQIDDGWQEGVGDWLRVNEKFPLGMRYLAQAIHCQNYQAGLWLAPFICERNSEIFRNHSHWILKDEKGRKVKAGFNPGWSGEFYALDFYNPEVRTYLKGVFQTILEEWEFDMVKLDFLYGVAIIPQKGKSRGEVMAEAMQFLRECCGEKKILGCGVPLNAAMLTTDFCRIGPDIGLKWGTMLKLFHNREGISTEYGIQNATFRHQLNGHGFLNDPDVYNLRSKNNKLTQNQKYTLYLTNQIFGGLCFTSDNISEYTAAEMHLYNAQFPFLAKNILSVYPLGQHIQCTKFQIGEYKYLTISNLSKEVVSFAFPEGNTPYVYFDSAQNRPIILHSPAGAAENISLAPYETRLFLQKSNEKIAVLYDNIHLFAGSEIEKVEISANNEVKISFLPNVKNSGTIWLLVPTAGTYLFHNKEVMAEKMGDWGFLLKLTE